MTLACSANLGETVRTELNVPRIACNGAYIESQKNLPPTVWRMTVHFDRGTLGEFFEGKDLECLVFLSGLHIHSYKIKQFF